MKTAMRILLAFVVCGLLFVGCDRKPNATGAGSGASGGSSGNGGSTDSSSLKLAFVTNNASEFWKIAAAGVHKHEKEAGVQVDIKMPPNGKVEEQNQILENLVTQGYN